MATLPWPLATDSVQVAHDPVTRSLLVRPARGAGYAGVLWREGYAALTADGTGRVVERVWGSAGGGRDIAGDLWVAIGCGSDSALMTRFTGSWPVRRRWLRLSWLTVPDGAFCVSGSAVGRRAKVFRSVGVNVARPGRLGAQPVSGSKAGRDL